MTEDEIGKQIVDAAVQIHPIDWSNESQKRLTIKDAKRAGVSCLLVSWRAWRLGENNSSPPYTHKFCRGAPKKDLNPKTANNSRRFGFRVMLQWFDPDCFNWLIAARW